MPPNFSKSSKIKMEAGDTDRPRSWKISRYAYENLLQSLTEEGRQSIKENGITLELLTQFSDNDLKDLFSSFMDRFHIRQFLSIYQQHPHSDHHHDTTHTSIDNINTSTDVETTSASCLDMSLSSTSEFEDLHTPDKAKGKKTYTVDEMLTKKGQRKVPSAAQKYFVNLLRDAAQAANVWKGAPPLHSISSARKKQFFDAVFQVAPNLQTKKREIWQRLGQTLQNRRKYLRDKAAGKRKSQRSGTVLTKPNTTPQSPLSPGSHIYLLDKEKKVQLAQGVVLLISQDMFVEIALKQVTLNSGAADSDLELPESVCLNGTVYTSLSSNLVNSVIKWRKDRLSLCKPKAKPKEKEKVNKGTNSNPSQQDNEFDSGSDLEQATDRDHTAGSTSTCTVTTSTKKRGFTKVPERKLAKKSQSSSGTCAENPRPTTGTQSVNFRSFCLMEWSNKKLYWGIKQTADLTDDFLIRNAVKSCGMLGNSAEDIINCSRSNVQSVKLSSSDYEVNPNLAYCIWSLPATNEFMSLEPLAGSKFGTIKMKENGGGRALKVLQEKLDSYVKS